MAEWIYVRDVVVLDSNLAQWIRSQLTAKNIQPGSTLQICGREITIVGELTFRGYNFEFASDQFDGSSGTLMLMGFQGSNASPPSLPGDNGLAGAGGTNGGNLTINCKNFAGLRVTSVGGNGGAGSDGNEGAMGFDGVDISAPKGGPGGPGGNGGSGGAGAAGGSVLLRFIMASPNSPRTLNLSGGSGGAPGQAGRGGSGGNGWENPHTGVQFPPGPKGPNGRPGSQGAKGSDGVLDEAQIGAADYEFLISPFASNWNPHRVRMGNHRHRLFTENERALALAEYNAVLAIEPGNISAMLSRRDLLNGLTPVGLMRNIDVIADYRFFDEQYNMHRQPVSDLFDSARDMLLAAGNLSQELLHLDRAISSITGLLGALDSDLRAAQATQQAANAEANLANALFADANARAEAIRQQLDAARMALRLDSGEEFIAVLGVFKDAIASIVAIVGAIESGQAVYALVGNFASGEQEKIQAALLTKEGRAELAKAKGLEGLIADSPVFKGLVNFPKALSNIMGGTVIDANGNPISVDDTPLRQALWDVAVARHNQLIAGSRGEQATAALEAAGRRKAQAEIDLANAQEQRGRLATEPAALDTAGRALLGSAQYHADILMRTLLRSVRALEIFTVSEKADLRFDYGYIHPDRVRDFEEGVIGFAAYAAECASAWGISAGQIRYAEEFLQKYGELDHNNREFIRIDDPAVLTRFKQTMQLPITIRPNDLPGRFEAKVDSLNVTLNGANAPQPSITVFVRHGGLNWCARRDGSLVVQALTPQRVVVQAAKEPQGFSGKQVESDANRVRGRGVATDWVVYLDPSISADEGVDLSRLQSIEFRVDYSAVI